jgi:hypothetical protein
VAQSFLINWYLTWPEIPCLLSGLTLHFKEDPPLVPFADRVEVWSTLSNCVRQLIYFNIIVPDHVFSEVVSFLHLFRLKFWMSFIISYLRAIYFAHRPRRFSLCNCLFTHATFSPFDSNILQRIMPDTVKGVNCKLYMYIKKR